MTGLHVPGVNLHEPDLREQLRRALADVDAVTGGDLSYLSAAPHAMAVLYGTARELLAELDTEQGDEPQANGVEAP